MPLLHNSLPWWQLQTSAATERRLWGIPSQTVIPTDPQATQQMRDALPSAAPCSRPGGHGDTADKGPLVPTSRS